MNYIVKPKIIKRNQFINKNFSLSGKDFRILKSNNHTRPILDFLITSYTGKEIGSEAYMNKSSYRFIKTFNLGNSFSLITSKFEYCKPINNIHPENGDILIAKDGGGEGLGESVIYNIENIKKYDSISAGVLGMRIENSFKYYIFGFIKSKYFKNFIDLNTAQGSTIRHSKKVALNFLIPFPTLKNNQEPKKVENLIALLVQNIIDKEEQIKSKNKIIDSLIENELKENQNNSNPTHNYPKISEIKEKDRLDSGLYGKRVKDIDLQIANYKNGSLNIIDNFDYCRGQNLQISQIGESYYSKEKKDNFYRMFTNVEMQDNRTISGYRWLGNKNKLTTLPENAIMFAADGMIVGRSFFFEKMENTITNIHPWIITAKEKEYPIYKRVFLSLFLSYLKNIGYLEKIKDKSNGGGLKKRHLDNYIKYPNFSDEKQKEISIEYYNKVDKNINLINYLEKNQKRNKELGIYQLNMEIFDLKEKLEDLIHKIVMDEFINISNYLSDTKS